MMVILLIDKRKSRLKKQIEIITTHKMYKI